MASVSDLLVNTQKKNSGESGMGGYAKTLNQTNILRKTQKDDTVLKT